MPSTTRTTKWISQQRGVGNINQIAEAFADAAKDFGPSEAAKYPAIL
jgi:hypothetical protein